MYMYLYICIHLYTYRWVAWQKESRYLAARADEGRVAVGDHAPLERRLERQRLHRRVAAPVVGFYVTAIRVQNSGRGIRD